MPDCGMRWCFGVNLSSCQRIGSACWWILLLRRPPFRTRIGMAAEDEALMRVALESSTEWCATTRRSRPSRCKACPCAVGRRNGRRHCPPLADSANSEAGATRRLSTRERLRQVLLLVKQEDQVLQLGARITSKWNENLEIPSASSISGSTQGIQNELMTREDRLGETESTSRRSPSQACQVKAEKGALRTQTLDRMPASSPEGIVVRNYLDCVTSLRGRGD